MTKRRLASLTLAATLAMTAAPAAPALADGAASTRNILLGGAAAAAALIIINHNKQVHAKYAEYDRRQAETQAQANDAEAAYDSERQAYAHEAALVGSYQHEVAIQHNQVVSLRHQLAMTRSAEHRLAMQQRQFHPLVADARVMKSQPNPNPPIRVAPVSYGWGTL